MSSRATGTVSLEVDDPELAFFVEVRNISALTTRTLDTKPVSKILPQINLRYDEDIFVDAVGGARRTLEFRVLDKVGRVVKKIVMRDVDGTVLDLGTIQIPKADASGWLVTKGTGAASPPVTRNNAVKLLIDNVEAWGKIIDLVEHAESSIDLMQLRYEIADEFSEDPNAESPNLVLQFGTPLSATQLRKVNDKDLRAERLLAGAATKNPDMPVRVLIWDPKLDIHVIGASLILPGLGLIAALIAIKYAATLDDVQHYFGEVDAANIHVLGAASSFFGPVHAKQLIVDGRTVVNMASPFESAYFGDNQHLIDDPRRGNTDHLAVHDVSIAVTGPAVADAHDTFRRHWNAGAKPADQVQPIERPPEQTDPGGLDGLSSLQVVRTINSGMFSDLPDGEQGVLEAYLRAIGNAQKFIYLENQYLTNEAIGNALAHALTDLTRPNLNVILLLNIEPDLPLYPRWQRKLVARIRDAMKKLGQDPDRRFGVFTRWTHEPAAPPGQVNPRIAPNYLHTKVGIVDDTWAAVGSANLDGASLDFFQILHGLQFGDVRETEMDFVLLGDVEGQPHSPVISLLRRRLFAEHLGIEVGDVPSTNDPNKGWTDIWNDQWIKERNDLTHDPIGTQSSHVLRWPDADRTLNKPREHLAEVLKKDQADLRLDPVKASRRFKFKEGTWRDDGPELDPAIVEEFPNA
ncbi:phospholipase D-like domain-containing protein [Actinomadura sp. DC4]|uniref:phospholipase D-like domain-containing protein n=1 Tax=Actinomadura sp. DC4 TaxID=3055069 RepID=UPI0025B1ECED|nr:phospholipase D-like domain-containing protein [Actinomadura sp. DC4]MDN3358541.1 phospholipase D-like domain-containing protein [Actinomadura sp. DC4]